MKTGTIIAFVIGFLMQPFWGILILTSANSGNSVNPWLLRAMRITCPLFGVSGVVFTSLATGLLYAFAYWSLISMWRAFKKSSSPTQPS